MLKNKEFNYFIGEYWECPVSNVSSHLFMKFESLLEQYTLLKAIFSFSN